MEDTSGRENVIPLKEINDPQSKTSRSSTGVILTRIRLIILAIAFLLLVVLVIILAALLGHARSKLDEGCAKEKEGGTVSPTVPSSPVPTTPGTEAWWNVRLPSDVIPVHYNVFLDINPENPLFDGNVEIFINVTQSTNIILVHTNKMNVTSVAVRDAVGGRLSIKKHFWFRKNQFYVLEMSSNLEPSIVSILMNFEAYLSNDMSGLYKGDYKKPNGKTVFYVTSQLVATEARAVFPCFDEPAMKATFNISVAHRPDLISISNMPIYKNETRNGKTYDYFTKTVRISTYLLAFVVCDFGYNEVTTDNNVTMRFYATPHQVPQMTYAPYVGSKVLTFYEQYYGIKYPLPKADMIAIPDFPFNAMENWGLIMYREQVLLWTQAASSENNKQHTASVIAHELAHQWFGNLVTMKWWDDVWLNEGFASYVHYLGLNAVEPTWKVLDDFVIKDLAKALTLDGLVSSHPIILRVTNPNEIGQIFDSITYNKGASILRMLDDFIGRDVFVAGVKRYLQTHAYGNAETNDLWTALRKESCAPRKCVDVKHVMDTWTQQMGYPVINLKRMNATHVAISQKRFLFDKKANVSQSKYKSPFNYQWVIPFTYVTSKDPRKRNDKYMDFEEGTIAWDGSAWIKGNYQHKGYYLVNYEDDNWDALAKQLRQNHSVFSASDRAGVIQDTFNLAKGGLLNYTKVFSLTAYMKNETDYVPWKAFVTSVGNIENILSRTQPAYKYLQKYLVYQTKKKYEELGFVDAGNHVDKLTRDIVLNINCKETIASCVDNATARFRKWMKDPIANSIPPNLRLLVYYYGIANGGVEEWDFAFSQFQKTKEATAKSALIYGMAASREPWILQRYDLSKLPRLEHLESPTTELKRAKHGLFIY